MGEGRMSEEETRQLFVAKLIKSSEEGPAPDCEEQLTAILAEHEAECAKLRQTQGERRVHQRRR